MQNISKIFFPPLQIKVIQIFSALQTPELESLLSSIIINLIIYAVHDDEHSSKISVLLSLVRAHDLNLWSDNVSPPIANKYPLSNHPGFS